MFRLSNSEATFNDGWSGVGTRIQEQFEKSLLDSKARNWYDWEPSENKISEQQEINLQEIKPQEIKSQEIKSKEIKS